MDKFDYNGCNNATSPETTHFTGNVVPHSWYKRITNSRGKPDLSAITILAEIVYWYRPKRDGSKKFNEDIWKTSYNYFIQKFGYNRQKLRRTFVKLEELGIIKRNIQHTEYYGHKFGNVLFIDLLDQSFVGTDKKISYKDVKNKDTLLQKCSNNIDKETNKEENRSNFSEFKGAKTLADYHPITETDLEILNKTSGRDFSLKAANQILQAMSSKLPGRIFKTKRAFLNYMSKAFIAELRQSVSINNKDFYITQNLSKQELNQKNIEAYLTKIEEVRGQKTEDLLKKKIVSLFDPQKAYGIIQNLRIEDSKTLRISFDNSFIISEKDISLIEDQAKFITGTPSRRLCKQRDVWLEIRSMLCRNLGREVDSSWFSRLRAEIDSNNKTISLEAETQVIASWVENHYGNLIRAAAERLDFKLLSLGF